LLHQSDKLLYKQALPSQPISEAQRFWRQPSGINFETS
jgi:hypothetical protein